MTNARKEAEFDGMMGTLQALSGMPMPNIDRNNLSAKSDAEVRYLALCKQELSLKIALKAIQETKKETEKELADLALIGQVKFEW